MESNIYNFFTSDLYNIKNINNNEYIIKTKNNDDCLNIYFLLDNIRIEKLSKCGENSGTYLLNKIEDLAKSIKNIQYITLLDTSEIKIYDCNIDLAILKILTKGESWYNQLGYFSSDYENEKIYNAEFLNMNFDKLISLCRNAIETYLKITNKENIIENIALLENNIKTKNKNLDNLIRKKEKYLKILDNYDNYIIEELEKINNNFNSLERKRITLFPEINVKINTKEYFNILVQLINTVEKCEFLKVLIEIIKPVINYNRNLVKKLTNHDKISEYKNGGKKKKQKQSKPTKKMKIIRRRTKNRKGINTLSRVKY
jgi:hypothetical protein